MAWKSSVLESVMFSITTRWADRLIGVLGTIILARLLVPEDFGIVAQAWLVIGLIGVLTDLGVNWALIQNRNVEREHYDTAWTIRLGQSACVALIVFIAAPLAGTYFGEPRVVPVLRILAAGVVLGSLANIGVITFQKELKFGLDFRYHFLRRIAAFVFTVTLAVVWRSYWALVVGTLIGMATGVLLSYLMHPMRPRLSLARFREIFSFSQWTLVRGIGAYLLNSLDQLLVGGRASSAVLGGYTLAKEIAAMPSSEVLAPLNRVLFPVFVDAKHNLAELQRLFLLAQGVQTLIAIPASVGLALVASDAVMVLLGEKWMLAVPFVQVLALVYVVHAITTSAGYVIITMGEMRVTAVIVWSQLALFAVAAVAVFPQADALEVAQLRLVVVCCSVLVTLWMLKRVLPNLLLRQILRTIARPMIGAAAMAMAIVPLGYVLPGAPLPVLLIKIVVGVVSYLLVVLLLWIMAGRPAGAETYVFDRIAAAWKNLRRTGPHCP